MKKRGISRVIIVFLVILLLIIAVFLFYAVKLVNGKKFTSENDCLNAKNSDSCYYSLAQNAQPGLCIKIQDAELKVRCESESTKYSQFDAPEI